MNSPDGKYTIRDDSLPHQIRLAKHGEFTRVRCTCLGPGEELGRIDPKESPWALWDAHLPSNV